MKTRAFLFDLNGTLIDDMNYHITAWQEIMNMHGAEMSFEKMKGECYGKNAELMERILPGRFNEKEKNTLSLEKERIYRSRFKAHLRSLPGLDSFLALARFNAIKMAIGSAAINENIDFVLDGLNLRHYFSAIISADDVKNSKPDPETYIKCAAIIQADPRDCFVFEDTPKGVETALNAGMQAMVINSMHSPEEFEQYPNIMGFAKDYETIDKELLNVLFKEKGLNYRLDSKVAVSNLRE